MKTLLIKPYSANMDNELILPMTVYHIGSVLRDAGHEIAIVDQKIYAAGKMECTYEEIVDDIIFNVDAVIYTVNTFDWCVALDDIRRIRQNGYEGRVIVGGVHAALAYTHIVKNFSGIIDFVMVGDAETNLVPLLAHLEEETDYSLVPGIAFLKDGKVKFNVCQIQKELAITKNGPAYDLMPDGVYESITYECSRGCFGRCSFCTIPFKRSWRPYDEEYIAHTLKNMIPHLDKLEGRRHIITTDDCFTTDPERAVRLLKLFKEYGLQDCEINLEARIMDLRNEELLSALKEFPKVHLQVGVEAGSDKGFKQIHKPVTMEMLHACSKRLAEVGLSKNVFYSFIVGLPQDTVEDCYTTLETSNDIFESYGIVSNIAFWIPLPSESYELLKTMVPDMDYSIYDELGWYGDKEFFRITHPKLTEMDIMEISQKVFEANSRQSLLKHDYL